MPLKPYEYFDNLNAFQSEKTHKLRGYDLAGCPSNGDLSADMAEVINAENISNLLIELQTHLHGKITAIFVDVRKIDQWFSMEGEKFINIGLNRNADIWEKIIEIKLYDEEGNTIHTTDCANVTTSVFHDEGLPKNATQLKLPIWCINYSDVGINVPYKGNPPAFYKIKLSGSLLIDRDMICQNYGNIPITHYVLPNKPRTDPVEVTSSDKWRIPYILGVVKDIKASEGVRAKTAARDLGPAKDIDKIRLDPFESTYFYSDQPVWNVQFRYEAL